MSSVASRIEKRDLPYSKTPLANLAPELRKMVFDYVFDNELNIWVTRYMPFKAEPDHSEQLVDPRPCISKNPRTHPLMNVCRQLRQELLAQRSYVTARTNVYAFAADLRLLSSYRTPPVKKIHLQLYKAAVGVCEYRQRLWQRNAGQLARDMPELEIVRVGVFPPRRRHRSIDDARTITALDKICQEVVDAHPGLNSFTHVVNIDGVISYTISK